MIKNLTAVRQVLNEDIVKLNSDISTLNDKVLKSSSQIVILVEWAEKMIPLKEKVSYLEEEKAHWALAEKAYNNQLKWAIPNNKYLLWLYNIIISLDKK